MADVHTAQQRRANMSAIRNKNTKPEWTIRRLLFAQGFRYRLHDNSLPGAPDLVLPRYRTVVFVHGCFWHGHDCYLFKWPQTRTEFWRKKITHNIERDIRDVNALQSLGFKVICIWECAVKGRLRWNSQDLATHMAELIKSSSALEFAQVRHLIAPLEPGACQAVDK